MSGGADIGPGDFVECIKPDRGRRLDVGSVYQVEALHSHCPVCGELPFCEEIGVTLVGFHMECSEFSHAGFSTRYFRPIFHEPKSIERWLDIDLNAPLPAAPELEPAR